jgi:hypothetical protein
MPRCYCNSLATLLSTYVVNAPDNLDYGMLNLRACGGVWGHIALVS